MAIVLVQNPTPVSGSSGTTLSQSFGSNNTAGNLIVVCAGVDPSGATISCADSRNTYLTAQSKSTPLPYYLGYALSIGSGANTVTITSSLSVAFSELFIAEFSGVASYDLGAQSSGTGTAPTSGSFTTTGSDLVVGFCGTGASASVGSGFTQLGYFNGDTSEYLVQSSSGSVAATFTTSTAAYVVLAASFKPTTPVFSRFALLGVGNS